MKTLFLMRHAKSTWNNPQADDHDRALNTRGLNAAAMMGGHLAALLAARELRLDMVFCSSAKRARQTWALVAAELAAAPSERTMPELYLCGPEGVLQQIRQVSDEVQCLLVVSHNPDLQILSTLLPGSGDGRMRQEAVAHFPTGSLTGLEFDCASWVGVRPGGGRMFEFATPKGLT